MHILTILLVAAAQVSGVIAVVVYGLYGSATAKWGLSPKVAESGVFDEFWDTIGFGITGMVFFFSGVSSVNFFVRSAQVGWLSLSLGIWQMTTRTDIVLVWLISELSFSHDMPGKMP